MSIIRLSLTCLADLKSVLDVGGKVLVVRGLPGWPLWEEDRGCPVPGTAGSRWLGSGLTTGHS